MAPRHPFRSRRPRKKKLRDEIGATPDRPWHAAHGDMPAQTPGQSQQPGAPASGTGVMVATELPGLSTTDPVSPEVVPGPHSHSRV